MARRLVNAVGAAALAAASAMPAAGEDRAPPWFPSLALPAEAPQPAPQHPCPRHCGWPKFGRVIIMQYDSGPQPRPQPTLAEAEAMLDSGRTEAALAALSLLARVAPQDPEVWTLLGRANRKLRHFGEARENLDRALRLDPDNPGALGEKGLLQLSTGAAREAQETLAKLARTCGDCAEHAALRSALGGAGYHGTGTGAKRIKVAP
jgi:tetratricopeptide (TPR) repeat protein